MDFTAAGGGGGHGVHSVSFSHESNFYILCLLFTYRIGVFQASNTVEVNIETAERLQISRVDFMASLNNDVKPVSRSTS